MYLEEGSCTLIRVNSSNHLTILSVYKNMKKCAIFNFCENISDYNQLSEEFGVDSAQLKNENK